ncbi:MAG: hypothetical protein KBA51_04705 [Kiritimatiellae bacterium]|nr:hypothetical protein [Kiritimatiellia bacterium]
MKTTKEQILKIVHDPQSQWSPFDDQQKRNFIGIWETRLMMAIEHHKSEDLRLLAEGVLNFVRDRQPDRLRLYGQSNAKSSMAFLFDMETEEYFQII